MQKDWIMVYSSRDEYKVEIIKALLEENDIESVIMNKKDSSYLFGDIELYVSNTEVIKAKQIIESGS
jgi:hypothetical protein